jgi:hypothetical protein
MSITLNLNQARELLEFFGGEDAQMTVGRCGPEAHSGPGLYAWLTEHPGEGSVKLDEQPDQKAPACPNCAMGSPVAMPSALTGLADYLRLMAHSQSAPETLRRWADEVERIAGVDALSPTSPPNGKTEGDASRGGEHG